MKKLLALILCVMLFVSVIPTMAFAADPDPVKDAEKALKIAQAEKAAADAQKALKKANDARKETIDSLDDARVDLMAAEGKLNNTKMSIDYWTNKSKNGTPDDIKTAKVRLAALKEQLPDAEKEFNEAKAAYDKALVADMKAETAVKVANLKKDVADKAVEVAYDPDNKVLARELKALQKDLAEMVDGLQENIPSVGIFIWKYGEDPETHNTQHTIISSNVFDKLEDEVSVADWIYAAVNGNVQSHGLELLK